MPKPKFSVLVADDNPAIREAIARSLTRHWCRVSTGASDVDALEAVRRQWFDVVISDLNMPDRGGLWLWREALALRPNLQRRFVLVASEPLPDPHSMSRFMESGRLLIKPVSLEALWRQVEDVIHGARRSTRDLKSLSAQAPPSFAR
jgi:DNA-binding NtrC family response regulator